MEQLETTSTAPGTSSFDLITPTSSKGSSVHISQKTSWGSAFRPPSSRKHFTNASKDEVFDEVDLNIKSSATDFSVIDGLSALHKLHAVGLSFGADDVHVKDEMGRSRFSLESPEPLRKQSEIMPLEIRPFNKWVRDIQKRAGQKRQTASCDIGRLALERELLESPAQVRARHKKSSSGSSFGFVTAVKSATVSLASFSIAPRSKRTGISSRHHRTDRSSKASNAGRLSEDSSYIASGIIDQNVLNRLLQRRRVIEEIINTEESYVGDVKFLMNVYVTLLASIPTLSLNLRASISRNLNDIVELHDELLGSLHHAVPHSEYTQMNATPVQQSPGNGHHRWRSLDAVPENNNGVAWLQHIPGMTAEPKVAAEVAKVFGKKMNRFFVYEEYGAKYEAMMKDVSTTYRTMPQWEVFQKGFESLASSVASISSQNDSSRKALAIGDLLVKPIQRICKYPLLFAELLKQTPSCDCPDSHIEIENVLIRLREATTEINRVTADPRMKTIMENTWLLQDRLIFTEMPDARSRSTVRGLGHIHLCGVLHVSWQSRQGVVGQYLICLLYRDSLLLASAPKADLVYHILACISLDELRVEEVDNGRGLQCHTASYSWKLVFEFDHQLFETTMSACSSKEEHEWRSRLIDRSGKDFLGAREQVLHTSLSMNMKSMGTVFGKPGTIARRISIHRATTVAPMSGLCHVIIKNTNALKDIPKSVSTTAINRSQSLLTTNRIPILAPSRADRIRLEALLADIWTRDVLPFPGMTGRARSEHRVRASASSMMRKLSVASIASNFTKRSGSVASLQRAVEADAFADAEIQKYSPEAEQGSGESSKQGEIDEIIRSRLAVIQDEKENFKSDSFENLSDTMVGPNGSPIGTMRRVGTSQGKKSWAHDRQRIVTPPLSTSSANSVNQKRNMATQSLLTETVVEEKENVSQSKLIETKVAPLNHKKWRKGNGKNRSAVTQGFRNLFR